MFIYLTPFRFFVCNPPPVSPSLDKGGGIIYLREASALFDSPLVFTLFKGEGERF